MQFQGIPSICPQRVSAKEVADCADIQIRVHLRKFVAVLATGNLSGSPWTDYRQPLSFLHSFATDVVIEHTSP